MTSSASMLGGPLGGQGLQVFKGLGFRGLGLMV